MGELFRAGTGVGALKQAAFVTKLGRSNGLRWKGRGKKKEKKRD